MKVLFSPDQILFDLPFKHKGIMCAPFIGPVSIRQYFTAGLTDSGLRVYAAYGSEDGVLNREKYEADRVNLPQDTTETVIDGGCHAGFGSYGAQKGDGAPVISAEEQQQQTADALAAWMNLQ